MSTSNVMTNNATKLAISNAEHEWSQDTFNTVAEKLANKAVKGVTRERVILSRNKLKVELCRSFKDHFPAVYGKTDHLPSDVIEKIDVAIDLIINKAMQSINTENALSYRRAFYHNSRDMMVSERVHLTGENTISLKEQLFGIRQFIRAQKKKIENLPQGTDRIKRDEYDAILRKMRLTQSFVRREIENQNVLLSEDMQVDE